MIYEVNINDSTIIMFIETDANYETTKKLLTLWFRKFRNCGTYNDIFEYFKAKGSNCKQPKLDFRTIYLSRVSLR